MPKSSIRSDKQLDICFNAQETLTATLNKTPFFIQLECCPETDGTLSSQTESVISAADELSSDGTLGFFLSSLPKNGLSISTVKAASRLSSLTQRPVTMALSGQGQSLHTLKEDAAAAKSKGLANFLAVTGNLAPDHLPDAKGNYSPYPNGYSDSLEILSTLRPFLKDNCIGGVVNPFKYTPEDQCLQYVKLFKKVDEGADFFITQAGWDMKKYQELQWFMQMRELVCPTLARICLLSQSQAQTLTRGNEAGIVLPLPIASKLQTLSQDAAAFCDYQLQLAALQCVGLRLIGYSGIQIAGITSADELKALYDAIKDKQESLQSYQQWLEAWGAFHGNISFAPPPTFHSKPHPHYLFSNLLDPEINVYDPQRCQFTTSTLEKASFVQRLAAVLLRPQANGLAAKIAKSIVKPGTEQTYGLDNSSCPKRLTLCPCGNSRSDGYCEANHAPCLFKQVADLSSSFNEMNILD